MLRGGESQDPPALAVLQEIDRAVRALADETDALAHVPLVNLLRLVAPDPDMDQHLPGQGSDEAVALPLGEHPSRIDQEAGRGDGRPPVELRPLEVRTGRMPRDRHSVIVL